MPFNGHTCISAIQMVVCNGFYFSGSGGGHAAELWLWFFRDRALPVVERPEKSHLHLKVAGNLARVGVYPVTVSTNYLLFYGFSF